MPFVRFAVVALVGLLIGVVAQPLGAAAAPANDDFPGTLIPAAPFQDSTDTTGATTEQDEPFPDCNGYMESTVWWQFTPTETAAYALTIATDGSWGPLFAVWGPSSFPGGGLSEIVCGGYPLFPGDPIPPQTEAHTAFQGDAGKTYYVQVGGFSFFSPDIKGSGPVTVSLEQAVAPPNDAFADATPVTLPFSDTQDITGATIEQGEAEATCLASFGGYPIDLELGSTIWYSYTAQDSGVVAVEASSMAAFPEVAIWTGAPGNLSEVTCGSPVGFAAEAGQTYYIQAGSLGIAGGEVPSADVRVDIQSVTPPGCPGATQQWSDETGDTFTYDEFGNDGIPA
ncbi:MAG TPA: hypothetical protein VMT24_19355, partial [Aggregatilineaceae bacterium]|nr:hypothetical protein [Aggregatilineaceae bacterium]